MPTNRHSAHKVMKLLLGNNKSPDTRKKKGKYATVAKDNKKQISFKYSN